MISASSATLVWKHPKDDKVDKFLVKFCPIDFHYSKEVPKHHGGTKRMDEHGNQVISIKYHAGRCTAIIRNLIPNTVYKVRVCAVNAQGEGRAATATIVTRDRKSEFEEEKGIWLKKRKHTVWTCVKAVAAHTGALVATAVFLSLFLVLVQNTFKQEGCKDLADSVGEDSVVFKDVCNHISLPYNFPDLESDAPKQSSWFGWPESESAKTEPRKPRVLGQFSDKVKDAFNLLWKNLNGIMAAMLNFLKFVNSKLQHVWQAFIELLRQIIYEILPENSHKPPKEIGYNPLWNIINLEFMQDRHTEIMEPPDGEVAVKEPTRLKECQSDELEDSVVEENNDLPEVPLEKPKKGNEDVPSKEMDKDTYKDKEEEDKPNTAEKHTTPNRKDKVTSNKQDDKTYPVSVYTVPTAVKVGAGGSAIFCIILLGLRFVVKVI